MRALASFASPPGRSREATDEQDERPLEQHECDRVRDHEEGIDCGSAREARGGDTMTAARGVVGLSGDVDL
jgi:hypothetical protein